MKILEKVKELSNIEFLWSIYIMKDTSNFEIEKCIQRIQNIKKINKRYFGFNLTEISNIQLSKYSYLDKGQYKTHQDVIWLKQKYHRKLTIIIQLSENDEYTGGNLCIDGLSKNHLKKKGTLIVFPSFFYHSVERVLSGERLSLVAWFSGKFWK